MHLRALRVPAAAPAGDVSAGGRARPLLRYLQPVRAHLGRSQPGTEPADSLRRLAEQFRTVEASSVDATPGHGPETVRRLMEMVRGAK